MRFMAGDVSSTGPDAGQRQPDRQDVPPAPLALYRRYRPASFAEVKGQDHVTEPLRQALRSGRVHHAYLFSGPRGCGKTSSARILARSLNCELGPTPDPCGTCASCVALGPAGPGSIDVIEIDAASHGGIDDARDLRERAFYSPVAARYKIYIIDEAHMVTGAGFNALLKLVEEPPPHLKFVFATTEPEKVIPTIRSRTHHYPFRLMPPAILRELLEEILAAEGLTYEPSVLPVVIRAGGGSARDSLSVLDQLIAGADESGLRYDRAIALLGYTDDALLDQMAEALASGDGAGVFLAIDHVVEAGHDPRRFAMDLLDRLRDLIVLAAVPDAATSGLLDAPEDQLDRMRKQATRFGQERLARAAETISAGLVEMRGATSPRLLLELMCAQVLLPAGSAHSGHAPAVQIPDGSAASGSTGSAGSTGVGDLAARVERLERQLAARPRVGPAAGSAAATDTSGRQATARQRETAGAPGGQPEPRGRDVADQRGAGPRPGAAPGSETGPAVAGTRPGAGASGASPPPAVEHAGAAATAVDATELRNRWAEILEAVRDVRKTAWILLSNYASIDAVEGNVLTMAFDSEGNAKGFASSGSDSYLADVLHAMFGVRLVVRAVVQPAAARGAARAAPRGRDDDQDAGARQRTGPGSGPGARGGPASGYAAEPGSAAASHPDEQSSAAAGSGAARGNPGPGARAGGVSRSAGTDGLGEDGDEHGQRRGAGQPGGTSRGPGEAAAAGQPERGSASRASAVRQPDRGAAGRSAASRPGPARRSTAAGAAGTPARGPASSDLRDDPRPHTDATPAGAAGDLTGTDLIMRELGGHVIEESTEP